MLTFSNHLFRKGFGFLLIVGIVSGILFLIISNNPIGSSNAISRSGSTGYPILRIVTREEGIYQIHENDLKKVGVTTREIDIEKIKMYRSGEEQVIWVDSSGDEWTIRFYGRPLDNIYTDENVYWLTLSDEIPGWVSNYHALENYRGSEDDFNQITSQMKTIPLGNSYLKDIILEENNLYKPQVDQEDHWFWLSLTSPEKKEVNFPVSHKSDGIGSLVLDVWGVTQSPLETDHHLLVELNDKLILDEKWDGSGRYILKTDIDSKLLKDGENVLNLSVISEDEAYLDIIYLNKLKIQIPHLLIAEDQQLLYQGTGERLELGALEIPVRIYDITNPGEVVLVLTIDDGEIIIDSIAEHRYLAIGKEGALNPVGIEPASTQPDLFESKNGSDYLAIGPHDLLEPLEPLLSLRAEQGFVTSIIPVEAVYDQFGGGIPEPDSIRRFLNYANENWSTAPKYLLLVGDASYDPKGYISDPSVNRLPVYLVNTVYGGQTGSDLGYAQPGSGNWDPALASAQDFQLAIGRLPAKNPSEVKDYVDKVLMYEEKIDNPDAEKLNLITAIADNQSLSFTADAEHFLKLFNTDFSTKLISPVQGESDVTRKILDQFNENNLFVAYFGHGSINMWGKERLFHIDDVKDMENINNYPIIFNLTCLTGLFTHPTTDSLAEKMIFQADRGAVALLAPTSLTLSNDQSLLIDELVTSYLSSPDPRIGDLLNEARKRVPLDTMGKRDVVFTFLLFGDPALRIPTAEE